MLGLLCEPGDASLTPAPDAVALRPAQPADAGAISNLCIRALRETNAKDYSPRVIARIVDNFSPQIIGTRIENDLVVVAHVGARLIGTGGLNGDVVKSLFVDPDAQGRGVGTVLMREIERLARASGMAHLRLQSSITAQGFYEKHGFTMVRECMFGEERTIVMLRVL